MKLCRHKKQHIVTDLCLIGITVLIFFVLREIFTWFCKSNQVILLLKTNQKILKTIENVLQDI